MSKPAYLIAVEGIDGCGKSTLAQNIYNQLQNMQIQCLLTREPTRHTPDGQKIRHPLHRLSADEEINAFLNDRKWHVEHIIQPAINDHTHVMTDRYLYSSVAYQSILKYREKYPNLNTQNLDLNLLDDFQIQIQNLNCAVAPHADIILFCQIDPDIAEKRITKRISTKHTSEKQIPKIDAFENRENLELVNLSYQHYLPQIPHTHTISMHHPPEICLTNALKILAEYIPNIRL